MLATGRTIRKRAIDTGTPFRNNRDWLTPPVSTIPANNRIASPAVRGRRRRCWCKALANVKRPGTLGRHSSIMDCRISGVRPLSSAWRPNSSITSSNDLLRSGILSKPKLAIISALRRCWSASQHSPRASSAHCRAPSYRAVRSSPSSGPCGAPCPTPSGNIQPPRNEPSPLWLWCLSASRCSSKQAAVSRVGRRDTAAPGTRTGRRYWQAAALPSWMQPST